MFSTRNLPCLGGKFIGKANAFSVLTKEYSLNYCGLFLWSLWRQPKLFEQRFFRTSQFEQRFFRMSLPIDKMFRVQTHQCLWTFIFLALSRGGPQGQLARQISRCFWVLDHPFEFALPHLPCSLPFGLRMGRGKGNINFSPLLLNLPLIRNGLSALFFRAWFFFHKWLSGL